MILPKETSAIDSTRSLLSVELDLILLTKLLWVALVHKVDILFEGWV